LQGEAGILTAYIVAKNETGMVWIQDIDAPTQKTPSALTRAGNQRKIGTVSG
jgi:hypothetical protein